MKTQLFSPRSGVYACAVLSAQVLVQGTAFAQAAMDCAALPNPVFVGGSSAMKPVLKALGIQLAGTNTLTLIYQGSASCNGVTAFTEGTKLQDAALYWDAAGLEHSCTPALGGVTIDVGVSDVFPSTCTTTPVPADVHEYTGPIQAMAFVTGASSPENSISAEAAYVILGFGGASPNRVAPWVDPNFFFIRPDSSGTKKLIATAIGLPAAKWNRWWPDAEAPMHVISKSGDVLAAVAASTNGSATLGILAADWFDDYRQPKDGKQIKVLAFQHKNQSCGYLPDSSSTSFDKLNVREGRYAMWGPVHLLAKVGADQNPANANAAKVISFFTRDGLTAADKQKMIDLETTAHTIPQCAMKVRRMGEMDKELAFTPDEPCGCYFEQKAGGAASSACTACTDDSACSGHASTPKCRYGFCEAK